MNWREGSRAGAVGTRPGWPDWPGGRPGRTVPRGASAGVDQRRRLRSGFTTQQLRYPEHDPQEAEADAHVPLLFCCVAKGILEFKTCVVILNRLFDDTFNELVKRRKPLLLWNNFGKMTTTTTQLCCSLVSCFDTILVAVFRFTCQPACIDELRAVHPSIVACLAAFCRHLRSLRVVSHCLMCWVLSVVMGGLKRMVCRLEKREEEQRDQVNQRC